jgi:hypothetical protein
MNYFDDEQIKKGKKLVLSIIIMVLAVEVFNFIHYILTNGFESVFKQLASLGLFSLFSYLFYKGYKWTEFIIPFLLFQDILEGIFYLLKQAGILLAFSGWLMLIITVVMAVFGGLFLGGSDNLSAFMRYQKELRR